MSLITHMKCSKFQLLFFLWNIKIVLSTMFQIWTFHDIYIYRQKSTFEFKQHIHKKKKKKKKKKKSDQVFFPDEWDNIYHKNHAKMFVLTCPSYSWMYMINTELAF